LRDKVSATAARVTKVKVARAQYIQYFRHKLAPIHSLFSLRHESQTFKCIYSSVMSVLVLCGHSKRCQKRVLFAENAFEMPWRLTLRSRPQSQLAQAILRRFRRTYFSFMEIFAPCAKSIERLDKLLSTSWCSSNFRGHRQSTRERASKQKWNVYVE